MPITWLWLDWVLATKLTILAAAGKTTLALARRCRMQEPGQCAGMVERGRGRRTLVSRLIAAGADLARCHFMRASRRMAKRAVRPVAGYPRPAGA